ncbi:MAG TPA: response regulator [Polyangiaceae bacterium]|jgi:DNA-binding NtrC family response regulator|nr:response regulator [Polyangiaceae bacterium]
MTCRPIAEFYREIIANYLLDGAGTWFAESVSTMPPAPPPGADAAPPIRYKVLLVDDDAAVLRSLAAALEFDLDIVTCNSAERALTLLASGDFHVVCTDYSMESMSGLDLLERVAQLPVPIGCLLVTGSTSFSARHGAGAGDHYVLMKPVAPERVSTLIMQLARTAEMKRGAKRVARSEIVPKGGR